MVDTIFSTITIPKRRGAAGGELVTFSAPVARLWFFVAVETIMA
jgi:hypothetical protein